MSVVDIKLYDFVRKEMNLSEEKAKEFVQAVCEVVKEDIRGEGFNELATKSFVKDETRLVKDEIHRLELKVEQGKTKLIKTIFWAVLIQFLVIIVSIIIGIIYFIQFYPVN